MGWCLHQCLCSRQPLQGLQTRTIALMALPIGWPAGLWARKHGAAKCMGRVALEQLVVVQHPRPMIAMQDLPIGWLDGLWPRRRGVASMVGKVAHLRQADAHRVSCEAFSWVGPQTSTKGVRCWRCAPSSGAE